MQNCGTTDTTDTIRGTEGQCKAEMWNGTAGTETASEPGRAAVVRWAPRSGHAQPAALVVGGGGGIHGQSGRCQTVQMDDRLPATARQSAVGCV